MTLSLVTLTLDGLDWLWLADGSSLLHPLLPPPTFPVVGTRGTEVYSVLGEAAAGAQLAHASLQVVSVAVTHLIVVCLPVITRVELEVVATHIALAHHAPLVFKPRPQHLGVPMGTDLGTHNTYTHGVSQDQGTMASYSSHPAHCQLCGSRPKWKSGFRFFLCVH